MRVLLAASLLLATVVAQQAPAPRLELLGGTVVRGGLVKHCAFDDSGTRMLTIGAAGDAVLHVLDDLAVLGRFELPRRDVTSVAMHPLGAHALIRACDTWGQSIELHELDLATGSCRLVTAREVVAFAFDAEGDRVGWSVHAVHGSTVEVWPWPMPANVAAAPLFRRRLNDHVGKRLRWDGEELVFSEPPGRGARFPTWRVPLDGGDVVRGDEPVPAGRSAKGFVTSSDGRIVAKLGASKNTSTVDQVLPERRTWSLRDLCANGLRHFWVAPGGELVTADGQGQLHVLGPESERRRLAAMHRGPLQDLVWSPDGQSLAVVGVGGVTFCDRRGAVLSQRIGSRAVQPGEVGPEFVCFDRLGFDRFHAAAARTVGERVVYGSGVRFGPVRTLETPSARVSDCSNLLCSERVAQLVGEALSPDVEVGQLRVDPLGKLGRLGGADPGRSTVPLYVHTIVQSEDPALRLVLWSVPADMVPGLLEHPQQDYDESFVRAIGDDDSVRGECKMQSLPLWLRRAPDGRCYVGLLDGRILALVACDLPHPQVLDHDPDQVLTWCDFVDEHHAIAGDGQQLVWIDTRTWRRTPLPLPAGVAKVQWGRLSPDGTALALSLGEEVRIVAVNR